MAYLDALGIDSYVSRTQLPGAALTRRLAIAFARATPVPAGASDAPILRVTSAPLDSRSDVVQPGPGSGAMDHSTVASPPLTRDSVQRVDAVPRFSLVAIVAGQWLWLEELAPGMPLTTEQVQLVQSMAHALVLHGEPRMAAALAAAQPRVAQFDWPIHTNQQLDLGAQAARASVAGFVSRRLEQQESRGLVLLGRSCAQWVPLQELDILTVSTASSAEILAQPTLKRAVWRDLLPLVSKP